MFDGLSHIFEILLEASNNDRCYARPFCSARSSSATKVAWLLVLCCDLCRFGARDLMRIFISSQDCNILRDDKWRAIRFYVASNWNDDLITWYVCIANAKCLQFVFRNWRRVDDDLHLECFVQQRLFFENLVIRACWNCAWYTKISTDSDDCIYRLDSRN